MVGGDESQWLEFRGDEALTAFLGRGKLNGVVGPQGELLQQVGGAVNHLAREADNLIDAAGMPFNEQADGMRHARLNGAFPLPAHGRRDDFNRRYLGDKEDVSGARFGNGADPRSARLDHVAFDQGAAIKEVAAHGPWRRSASIVSERGGWL